MNITPDKIKEELLTSLKKQYPNLDTSRSSAINVLTSQITYLQTFLNESIEVQFSEQFIDSATDPENVHSILSLYPHDRLWQFPPTSTLYVTIYFPNPQSYSTPSPFEFNPGSYMNIKLSDMSLIYNKNRNIEYTQIDTQDITVDTKTIIDNNYSITFPITVSQIQKVVDYFEFSGNTYVEQKVIQSIPVGQYLLPDTITQRITFDNIHWYPAKVQKNIFELYEELELKKNNEYQYYFLIDYSERNGTFSLIQQDIFNYKQPKNYTVEITYYVTYGVGGNVERNSLDVQSYNLYIEYIDSQGIFRYININKNNTINTNLNDKNKNNLTELLYGVYTDVENVGVNYYRPYISHEDITNGKNRESLDTYIINATRINRTFGYQITKDDFNNHMEYLGSTFFNDINYRYTIVYDNTIYSNLVTIYVKFIDNISQIRKNEYMQIIKNYFSKIVPFGTIVSVQEQKEILLYLTGTIEYVPEYVKQQVIVKTISDLLINLNMELQKSKILNYTEISQYDIQKQLYSSLNGIKSIDLYLYTNTSNYPLKVIRIPEYQIPLFDLTLISNINNYITFLQR